MTGKNPYLYLLLTGAVYSRVYLFTREKSEQKREGINVEVGWTVRARTRHPARAHSGTRSARGRARTCGPAQARDCGSAMMLGSARDTGLRLRGCGIAAVLRSARGMGSRCSEAHGGMPERSGAGEEWMEKRRKIGVSGSW
ncbi:hypothetical protein GUJ93_ZPchr0008g13390 [Zizania palustris]|uniref:Uncharacterized protein n=1 Tax=Zizania palustris TaxID=103762 RepID=A0A8J5V273_ZIZPA|nr:hypothetical protein GUJ93_ZPchr0008g13390 [Zizania palustris]